MHVSVRNYAQKVVSKWTSKVSNRDTTRQPSDVVHAKIVLSYRRSDSAAMAGRLFKQLQTRFGDQSVYMDIDNIPFGINFRDHIDSALKECKVLVVLIGPKWVGRRLLWRSRIFDVDDPVRLEIQTALRMKVPVLPVLIDRMEMPEALRWTSSHSRRSERTPKQ